MHIAFTRKSHGRSCKVLLHDSTGVASCSCFQPLMFGNLHMGWSYGSAAGDQKV